MFSVCVFFACFLGLVGGGGTIVVVVVLVVVGFVVLVVLVVRWRPDVAALSGWREWGRQTFLFHPSSFLLHQPLDLPFEEVSRESF